MPRFMPLPLRRMREPFDHPNWLYELKYDGFRALAHVDRDGVELVSRNRTDSRRDHREPAPIRRRSIVGYAVSASAVAP